MGGRDLQIEDVRSCEAGVLMAGAGSTLSLQDVLIDATLPRECVVDTCAMSAGGTAVALIDGAHLTARSFVLRGSALAGLQIARGATVDVSIGIIERNTIGVSSP